QAKGAIVVGQGDPTRQGGECVRFSAVSAGSALRRTTGRGFGSVGQHTRRPRPFAADDASDSYRSHPGCIRYRCRPCHSLDDRSGRGPDARNGSPSITADAFAVSVPTGTEEGSHGGPGFSPSNEKSVACPVMYLTDDPEYEAMRVAQAAQIHFNRWGTKTAPTPPAAPVGHTASTSTAAPSTPKTDQPFKRVVQGKWLPPDYSSPSEDGLGEDDGWG
ncbi:unnamed protein product, partial [Ectocarpus fasciculatus]